MEFHSWWVSSVLPLCVLSLSLLSCFVFSGSSGSRGRSESRGIHWSFLPLFCIMWPRLILAQTFIKAGSFFFFHCVSCLFPESEIRARLQSASPTACRCKTTEIGHLRNQQSSFISHSPFMSTAAVKAFTTRSPSEQCWIMMLSNPLAEFTL